MCLKLKTVMIVADMFVLSLEAARFVFDVFEFEFGCS